jgi:hypothetical protein
MPHLFYWKVLIVAGIGAALAILGSLVQGVLLLVQ